MWRQVKRIVESFSHFILTTHLHPDGDGIGSAVALIEFLLHHKKKVSLYIDGPLPEKFRFLDFHNLFHSFTSVHQIPPAEVLIVLDTARKERIGQMAQLLDHRPSLKVVCIDHHPPHPPFLTTDSVIDPEACAVGAMLYTFFKECGFSLNLPAAMGLYTSVISDTGRFSYGSTTRKAHKIAEECLKVGVDPSYMHTQLFQQTPLLQMEIFSNTLPQVEYHFDQKVLLHLVKKEDYLSLCPEEESHFLQDFDYFHEFFKTLRGPQCVAILWELPNGAVRLSLRSNANLDIVTPMRHFGGGGHPNAAGALVQLPFEQVKKQLLELLSQCFLSFT